MKYRLLIVLAMVLVGVYFYNALPDPMPTHWNFAGQVDDYGAKIWAAWLLPGVALLMTLLFPVLAKIDPRHKNYEKFKTVWEIFQSTFVIFFAYIYGVMLYIILAGAEGDTMGRMMFVGIGILFVILGNYMGKIRWNYFVGIKTPWTLNDQEVWQRTHRLGGWAFVLAGIIFLLQAWWYQNLGWVFGLVIAGVVVVPVVYSYIISPKK